MEGEAGRVLAPGPPAGERKGEGNADQELKALGLANILVGLGGGMVAVNSFNRSMLNLKAGANSRWSARFCALVVLGVVLLAPGLIGWMPKPVLTGLILFKL